MRLSSYDVVVAFVSGGNRAISRILRVSEIDGYVDNAGRVKSFRLISREDWVNEESDQQLLDLLGDESEPPLLPAYYWVGDEEIKFQAIDVLDEDVQYLDEEDLQNYATKEDFVTLDLYSDDKDEKRQVEQLIRRAQAIYAHLVRGEPVACLPDYYSRSNEATDAGTSMYVGMLISDELNIDEPSEFRLVEAVEKVVRATFQCLQNEARSICVVVATNQKGYILTLWGVAGFYCNKTVTPIYMLADGILKGGKTIHQFVGVYCNLSSCKIDLDAIFTTWMGDFNETIRWKLVTLEVIISKL